MNERESATESGTTENRGILRSKRKRKSRTMNIDGHQVLVDTLTQSEMDYYNKIKKKESSSSTVKKIKKKKRTGEKTRSEAETKRLNNNSTYHSYNLPTHNNHTRRTHYNTQTWFDRRKCRNKRRCTISFTRR